MAGDFDFSFLQWVVFVLLLVPFLVPVVTSAVAVRVFGLGAHALWWGVGLGVVNIPASWAAVKIGVDVWNPFWEYGLGTWFIAMVLSALLTVLLLWWRARLSRMST